MSQSNKKIFIAELAAVTFMAVCLVLFIGRIYTSPQKQTNFMPVTEPPAIAPSPQSLRSLRTWTGANGKQVDARFHKYQNGKIYLSIPGKGIKKTMPRKFSENDIRFLKSHGVPLP